jgi:hypothetical protein
VDNLGLPLVTCVAPDLGPLRGRVTAHHRFMLKLHLGQIDSFDAAIASIDKEVDAKANTARRLVNRLQTLGFDVQIGYFCPTPRNGLIGLSSAGECKKVYLCPPGRSVVLSKESHSSHAGVFARIKVRQPGKRDELLHDVRCPTAIRPFRWDGRCYLSLEQRVQRRSAARARRIEQCPL